MLFQSLTDFLVLVLCNVYIRSPTLNEQLEQLTFLEGGKLWFHPMNAEGPEPIALKYKGHIEHIIYMV